MAEHNLEDRRAWITLSVPAATKARRMAKQMGVSLPETVRRALLLLEVYLKLKDNERLVIYNQYGVAETLRFIWEDK